MRHDDTLGAVDDERALLGHEREVAHEHGLGLDLTGEVVHELGLDVQRGGVGLAALLALVDGVLLGLEERAREAELHGLAEVFDRGDLLEDLIEAGVLGKVGATLLLAFGDTRLPRVVADQPVEALGLQREQIGNREVVRNFGERESRCSATVLGCGGGCVARSSQGNNLRGPRRVSVLGLLLVELARPSYRTLRRDVHRGSGVMLLTLRTKKILQREPTAI
jgi:hypothetical protein